ncbi:hypothetical protein ACLOJK_033257 [Asimina triloba]
MLERLALVHCKSRLKKIRIHLNLKRSDNPSLGFLGLDTDASEWEAKPRWGASCNYIFDVLHRNYIFDVLHPLLQFYLVASCPYLSFLSVKSSCIQVVLMGTGEQSDTLAP